MVQSGWGLAGGAILLFLAPLSGQAQDYWPERGENLKVLPPEISAADLRDTMRGFSMGLGVRCSFCHVGVEG